MQLLVFRIYFIVYLFFFGRGRRAPVAQWVKRWPTDLAVPDSSPAIGENLPNRKRGSIAHGLSLTSYHDITEILLKRT